MFISAVEETPSAVQDALIELPAGIESAVMVGDDRAGIALV